MIRWAARKDGAHGDPGVSDQKPSQYEQQLLARGEQHLADVQRAAMKRLQKIEASHNAAVDRFRRAVQDYCAVQDRYDEKRRRMKRDVVVHVHPLLYWLILSNWLAG